ncbi:hypothetical protein GCM10009085_02680 [Pseudomonas avellanae]|nr:hypothetical protein GCM10009085_02680 [Pseudomonas avellanae]
MAQASALTVIHKSASMLRAVMHFVTLRRTLKIGRRASRTACDAERRTIVKRFFTAMALTTQSAT